MLKVTVARLFIFGVIDCGYFWWFHKNCLCAMKSLTICRSIFLKSRQLSKVFLASVLGQFISMNLMVEKNSNGKACVNYLSAHSLLIIFGCINI